MEDDAEQQCEQALKLAQAEDVQGKNINVFQTMASVRISQCRNDDAKLCMQKVIELYENFKRTEKQEIEMNIISNEDEYEKPNYAFRVNTAKLLMELEMYHESEKILARLAKEFEKVVDVWYLMGVCCEHLKDYKSAVEYLQKAFNLAMDMVKRKEEDPHFAKEILRELQTCQELLQKNPPPADEDDSMAKVNEDDEWEDFDDEEDEMQHD